MKRANKLVYKAFARERERERKRKRKKVVQRKRDGRQNDDEEEEENARREAGERVDVSRRGESVADDPFRFGIGARVRRRQRGI